MKILWKKTEIITTFAGVLERKSVHLVVPHFWEGPQLGKILVFFFPQWREHENARNVEAIILIRHLCYSF